MHLKCEIRAYHLVCLGSEWMRDMNHSSSSKEVAQFQEHLFIRVYATFSEASSSFDINGDHSRMNSITHGEGYVAVIAHIKLIPCKFSWPQGNCRC